MKKIISISPAAATFLLLILCGVGYGQTDEILNEPAVGVVRQKLSVNRNLITQLEAQYLELKEADTKDPSAILKRKIAGVEFTLKALREDADRLRGLLPDKQRAQEYMKELVQYRAFKEKASRAQILASEYRAYGKSAHGTAASSAGQSPKTPTAEARKKTSVNRLLSKTRQLHENALALVADKHIKEAMAAYEEILMIDPADDQAYLILGHLCLLTGQYEKAEECFQNSLNIDPANRLEITPFYQNMIMQNPNDDMAYANLGFAYIMLDEVSNAKRAFYDALTINPENPCARQGLGIISNSL